MNLYWKKSKTRQISTDGGEEMEGVLLSTSATGIDSNGVFVIPPEPVADTDNWAVRRVGKIGNKRTVMRVCSWSQYSSKQVSQFFNWKTICQSQMQLAVLFSINWTYKLYRGASCFIDEWIQWLENPNITHAYGNNMDIVTKVYLCSATVTGKIHRNLITKTREEWWNILVKGSR